jgi:hypothetical protein
LVDAERAQALEDNAELLRHWNRNAVATGEEPRATEIRTKLEEAARPGTETPVALISPSWTAA